MTFTRVTDGPPRSSVALGCDAFSPGAEEARAVARVLLDRKAIVPQLVPRRCKVDDVSFLRWGESEGCVVSVRVRGRVTRGWES